LGRENRVHRHLHLIEERCRGNDKHSQIARRIIRHYYRMGPSHYHIIMLHIYILIVYATSFKFCCAYYGLLACLQITYWLDGYVGGTYIFEKHTMPRSLNNPSSLRLTRWLHSSAPKIRKNEEHSLYLWDEVWVRTSHVTASSGLAKARSIHQL